jgi:predicted Zn-dependent protease
MTGRLLGRAACALLFAGPVAAQPTFFDVERSAEVTTPIVRIAKPGFNETLDLVPAERLRLLREVKQRIEKESGVKAMLMLTEAGMPYPNASLTGPDTHRIVAINLAMLQLLGEDADAMAAVLGHQYAHIALKHSEGSSMQERVGASILMSVLMAAARVPVVFYPNPNYVPSGFSGAEEREADEKGMAYAAAAGYSADGGVRAWERIAVQRKDAPGSRASTHLATEERIGTMRTLAARYPAKPQAAPAAAAPATPAAPDPMAAISLKELQALEARGMKDSHDPALWKAIAGHYAAFGDVDAAWRAYGHVVRLEPRNLEMLEKLGALSAKLGDRAGAGEVWTTMLTLDPKRADAYFDAHILPGP